jgi:hypothetical protein
VGMIEGVWWPEGADARGDDAETPTARMRNAAVSLRSSPAAWHLLNRLQEQHPRRFFQAISLLWPASCILPSGKLSAIETPA